METENGGRGDGSWHPSHDNYGSSASMRMRRLKTHHESCFCGLKNGIKKSRTAENPNRLFYVCPRYRLKWVDDDVYEKVGICGTKKDAGIDMEVESNYDEWRLKVA
ncbi:uncharacterized protein DS421_5g136970 [Arachis hypogaea]|nr:uncharacterized protein DS421_5g136970 [Arachis hypogaea]